MGDNKVTIFSTILLLGALLSIGMTSDAAAAVTVDGTINGGEYANSVLVDSTPDLGGVYDPGTSGSFAGGQIAGQHSDWILHWDFDATNIYFAADPLGSTASGATGATEISAHLLAITGDPNVATLTEDCTGTFFDLFAHNFYISFTCDFTGPPPAFSLEDLFAVDAPSSTESFAQGAVTTTLLPLEWSNVRADLARAGDTTYDGNLQCVWFRVSAFDSRSVDNSAGPGARTIWLKLDPTTPNCGEEIFEKTLKEEGDCFTQGNEILVKQVVKQTCHFQIEYVGDPAVITDVVPAEWTVIDITDDIDDAQCSVSLKGKSGKSATGIDCGAQTDITIMVWLETRPSPGKGHKEGTVFKPTTCDPEFVVNDGATATSVEVDINNIPVFVEQSNDLTINAEDLNDLDCDGIENDNEAPGCIENPNPLCGTD